MASYCTTIDQLDARVSEIDSLLSGNLESLITMQGGLSLEQMHENAVKNLRGLLKCLGYDINDETDLNETMRKLNERIQQYHSTTMQFNGDLLRQNIINPLKNLIVDSEQNEIAKFNKLFKSKEILNEFAHVVDQLTDKIALTLDVDLENYTQAEVDLVGKALVDAIKNVTLDFNTGTVTVYGYSSLLDNTFNAKIEKDIIKAFERARPVAWSEVTTQMNGAITNRILILAQQWGIPIDGLIPNSTKNLIDTRITTKESNSELMVYFDIYESMSELSNIRTEKTAREYFENLKKSNPDKYDILLNQLLNNAKTFTNQFFHVNQLPPQRQTELTERFNAALEDIIVNYPASLFMGNNSQGVIGILGEIQGLYYVYSIMGDNDPSIDPSTIATWIGGNTTAGSGAKTGADIIIQEVGSHMGYGIQVKNSMDEFSSTSFSDFKLKEGDNSAFFTQLSNFGVPSNVITAIEDVFMMRGFNIGYKYNGTQPVAGNPKGPRVGEYKTDYNRILKLVQRAQQFMALAAAMIMRIQTLEGLNYTESNTLWIVGGTAIISAAQILNDLIDQIHGVENANSFKTSAATYVGDTGYTIVDYLSKQVPTKNLKTILRTSYNFHRTTSQVMRPK